MRRPRLLVPLVVLFLTSFSSPSQAEGEKTLSVTAVDSEPKEGQKKPSSDELAASKKDVQEHPDDRTKRIALVRALLAAKDTEGALAEAKAWRAKDAYNLVAVRALGDVHMERGEKDEAERVYSAIVELLPRDPDAQRALATLLKQRGDLAAAKARLGAALEARPEDARLMFELADVEMRLGQKDEAKARFEKILATPGTSEQVKYPTKLRLDQMSGTGDKNDVHVYLTWDTDRTDVDLWVITPSGEKVFYSNKKGKGGEALYDDVTTGYGPESFTAKNAQPGEYKVVVDYFSARRGPFPEARGEVVIVTDEGKPTEKRQVLPYRLYAEKQNVTVAKITVGGKR
jgi:tetratricopeptide (TPR) repeat protein